jgi:hypothetical protein
MEKEIGKRERRKCKEFLAYRVEIRVELRKKHSSLLQTLVNYGRKKLYNICPWPSFKLHLETNRKEEMKEKFRVKIDQ